MWPAFWIQNSANMGGSPPYWYEEIDIFEPGGCQVSDGVFSGNYHRNPDETQIVTSNNKLSISKKGIPNNDISVWHKYAVEWTPNKVIWYFDDVPFFTLDDNSGVSLPFHQNKNLWIDLQIDTEAGCRPSITNGYLGSFDINYFRYYELHCSNEIITEVQGNNYDFNTYNHDIKKSCIFNNTIVNKNNITVRAYDFVELKDDFEVPLGTTFSIIPTVCY